MTPDALRRAFLELKRDATACADGVTWRMYAEGLEGRLADLHERVHSEAYRATPSRRVNISKPDGGTRPLGVAAIEDKIVQKAVTERNIAVHKFRERRVAYAEYPRRRRNAQPEFLKYFQADEGSGVRGWHPHLDAAAVHQW